MSSSTDPHPPESAWDDPRVTAYVMGELSGETKEAFERQLQDDQALAAAVDEARQVAESVSDYFREHSGATAGLDDDRRQSILHASSVATSTSSAGWLRRHGVKLAVAAGLLFVLAGFFLPRPRVPVANEYIDVATGSAEVRTEQPQPASKPFAMDIATDEPLKYQPRGEVSADDVEVAMIPELGQVIITGSEQDVEEVKQIIREIEAEETVESQDASSRLAGEAAEERFEAAIKEVERGAAPVRLRQSRSAGDLEGMSMDGMSAAGGMYGASAEMSASEEAPADEPFAGDDEMMSGYGMGIDVGGGVNESLLGERLERTAGRTSGGYGSDKTKPRAEQIARVPNRPVAGKDVQFGLEYRAPARGVTPLSSMPREPSPMFIPDAGLGDTPLGTGPGSPGDQHDPIIDNPFKRVAEHPLSTFSIDVDTAAYSKVRSSLDSNRLPPPDAVRIEEMINYFDYQYDAPAMDAKHPFDSNVAVMDCPWNEKHSLARIAIKGKQLKEDQRPACNLVFLLDTSGSMNRPNKLPLVVQGMKMLLKQLGEQDRVAIVTYAGSAGLVLDSTKASKTKKIRRALTRLSAGGSTNGGEGIALAYQTARDHFIEDGVNRVILCSDGDFNVGTTSTGALVSMVETESKAGIDLTVLGFGMGNHNDAMMEKISGRGNGNYAFIDTKNEARKVLVEQTNSTLVTIAKDVKLQIEFNPAEVSAYRLIGYENRVLAKEDFNDDTKDAGEIGAGHSVTALYELVPSGQQPDAIGPEVDPLKYQQPEVAVTEAAKSGDLLTLKIRYKQPDSDTSTLIESVVKSDTKTDFDEADADARFAAAVAGFGMQLRRSPYAGSWTLSDVRRVAEASKGDDASGFRKEFIGLVKTAANLMGEQ